MAESRKSYTVEYKKSIVEESRDKNLTMFCNEKNLNIKMVQRWRSAYANLCKSVADGNNKKRKVGTGRTPAINELENTITDWIIDRRARGLIVRRCDIQKFALDLASKNEILDFKASTHWLDRFLLRNELSLRKGTSLFKLEDNEIVSRAIMYKRFVDNIDFQKYQLSYMIAMDETAVFMGQDSQTTVDIRGASSIYIPSTGYESQRVTCILALRLDGTKPAPFIIIKGKKNKIEQLSGVYILETEKAWSNQAAIRKWVDLMLPMVLRGNRRGLLIWDSASTHRANDMKNFLKERGVDQIMIPAGMTGYLQSLDLVINKSFKDNVRLEINEYIEKRMVRNEKGNFVKPNLQDIVKWVSNAWAKINNNCIKKALKAAYLDKSASFEESFIAKNERLGPLIKDKLNSQELIESVQNLAFFEDVAEEDDLTVFN